MTSAFGAELLEDVLMPYFETPSELAGEMADLIGVYGAHTEGTECPDDLRKMCRVCFVNVVTDRIKAAVKTERKMALGSWNPHSPC